MICLSIGCSQKPYAREVEEYVHFYGQRHGTESFWVPVAQLVKTFPAFMELEETSTCSQQTAHWIVSWASWIYSHIFQMISSLQVSLPKCIYFEISQACSHLTLFDLITVVINEEEYKLCMFSLCDFSPFGFFSYYFLPLRPKYSP
jgi:hypothetical protein